MKKYFNPDILPRVNFLSKSPTRDYRGEPYSGIDFGDDIFVYIVTAYHPKFSSIVEPFTFDGEWINSNQKLTELVSKYSDRLEAEYLKSIDWQNDRIKNQIPPDITSSGSLFNTDAIMSNNLTQIMTSVLGPDHPYLTDKNLALLIEEYQIKQEEYDELFSLKI